MFARLALRAGRRLRSEASLKELRVRGFTGSQRNTSRTLSSIQHGLHHSLSREGRLISTKVRPTGSVSRISNQRSFILESIPPILTPPLVFVGLLITLWTYKCMMMVIFQNKIIYMPNVPPFARSEKLEDYATQCKPVVWEQKHIKSVDGTRIALAVGAIPRGEAQGTERSQESDVKNVVICYFQGNGASLPPRMLILSSVLKILQASDGSDKYQIRYTVIALSYRGYWTSSGRASQSGIELDAQALLEYVQTDVGRSVELLLWGQSIGCGVTTTAAATYLAKSESDKQHRIAGMVLETPFTSVKSMLIALYPQKWLPYRYLYPFLWNHWDSEAALRQIAAAKRKPKLLLLPASRDEVVPSDEADKLEKICSSLKFDFERKDVLGALHNEATTRKDGQRAVAEFIKNVVYT